MAKYRKRPVVEATQRPDIDKIAQHVHKCMKRVQRTYRGAENPFLQMKHGESTKGGL